MDTGQIRTVLISTSEGHIIYERFYERCSEQDKAELRASLSELAEERLRLAAHQADITTRSREGAAVLRREGELHYFAVGDGEYDELNLAELLKALAGVLREVLKRQPTEANLFDNYGRMCQAINAVVFEGRVDMVEANAVQRWLT